MNDGVRDKLVATKQAWARAGRLLTGNHGDPEVDRLPPGQRLVTNWPVLDLGIQPDVPRSAWKLKVDGLVENPVAWDWDAFAAQPEFEDVSDVHCVTQWSRYDNRWTGVSVTHLLSVVRPMPDARHVILHGYDGYTTNVRLDHFSEADCLLAHSHDGVPLSREHGGPVRLIIPRYYLWKSAKWLKRIEFVGADKPGFWEVRGYHNEGDPWIEQRYG
ncbi:sulfite oxidase-like oxidoreductase [Polymorphobacter arshaanensis]|uniref:Sulfite oxidase-like oxidoreductase n=1 Tax=Glacieibacterium arshaanense TaxID=2511025 RepID=A0A4Y9ENW0_9SPHN|nr:sulfite oxidase-like oxidoreductase [Polymorphobacter arshaanensis]TFU03742.1 sulfite oxidase-like oxidoreductase [Polymorphobacter arshaanensis]